jgi:hypothetical protein
MLYKIDCWGDKVQKFFIKTKIQFIKLCLLELYNTHINHLTQISLINMTLKWRYVNMFEKIDSSLVVKHGFWLVWLWSHLMIILDFLKKIASY